MSGISKCIVGWKWKQLIADSIALRIMADSSPLCLEEINPKFHQCWNNRQTEYLSQSARVRGLLLLVTLVSVVGFHKLWKNWPVSVLSSLSGEVSTTTLPGGEYPLDPTKSRMPPMGKLHDGQNADGAGKLEKQSERERERERPLDHRPSTILGYRRRRRHRRSKVSPSAARSCLTLPLIVANFYTSEEYDWCCQ